MGVAIAFETSTRLGSVAAAVGAEEGARVLERPLERGRAHASDLLPAVDALLRELGAAAAGVTEVVVGTGPGSFTGLRVACATALGVARGTDARAGGVPSFEALSFARLEPGAEALFALDARAGELYFARYLREEDDVVPIRAPAVLAPAEAREQVLSSAASGAGATLFADASALAAAELEGALPAGLRVELGVAPAASGVLALGLRRLRSGRAGDVRPLYLRPFAARRAAGR